MKPTSVDGKICLMFPGQGSQLKGMGEDQFPKFPELVRQASKLLEYSIVELCVQNPESRLGLTQYTQPALFTVNALLYLQYLENNGKRPDYLIGHSLGEYNALFAAKAFDFEIGLEIVKKRGELFADIKSGGMLAVIGKGEGLSDLLSKPEYSRIDMANYNSEDQVILSGLAEDLKKIVPQLSQLGFKAIFLNVSGAFHSRQMEPARNEFRKFLGQFSFNAPEIPVISNYKCLVYNKDNIIELLTNQIVNPVEWKQQIYLLLQNGVSQFQEIGPGNVLSKLLEKNKLTYNKEGDEKKALAYGINVEKPTGTALGSISFKERYNTPYAYVAGAMYKGIASEQLVVRMANSNFLSFLGTGGQSLKAVEASIDFIRKYTTKGQLFGINFLHNPTNSRYELDLAFLCNSKEITVIEASAFATATLGLVYFRLKGAKRSSTGKIIPQNHILAKLSRPEVASVFLSPPPANLVKNLLDQNLLTKEESDIAPYISLASDITIESDSGGHTDQGVSFTLTPTIILLRDRLSNQFNYQDKINVGAAGGIGTPQAIAAAFMLGADYVLTGSVNQCTVEAGTSDAVKDLLSQMNVQDTAYAPAGDMFELGAKVQVLKRGVLFPNRANKLYELYKSHDSIDEIDATTRKMLEEKYFKKQLSEVWEDTKQYLLSGKADILEKISANPKQKMAAIFKWYFAKSTQYALEGNIENRLDFQIHCGPALGSFNQWVLGTALENWRNRHVDQIAKKLLFETENIFSKHKTTHADLNLKMPVLA